MPAIDDDDRAASDRHAKVVGGVTVVLVGLVVIAVIFEAYYRATYHDFAWWNPPPRIHWCGRDYDRSNRTVSRAAALQDGVMKRIGSVPPLFRNVYASSPQRTVDQTRVCTMLLFYERGANEFVSYSLSGGP